MSVLETVPDISYRQFWNCAVKYLSGKPFGIRRMYICTSLCRVTEATEAMTSQISDLSTWTTLCVCIGISLEKVGFLPFSL
jgi:hypothetical protein